MGLVSAISLAPSPGSNYNIQLADSHSFTVNNTNMRMVLSADLSCGFQGRARLSLGGRVACLVVAAATGKYFNGMA